MAKDQMPKEQTVFTEEELNMDQPSTMDMKPNLAAALSYFIGFITGIIFFVMEKENKYVRYHAMQSILISVPLTILFSILSIIPILGWFVLVLLSPVSFILWLFLMYKAYQGEAFKFPFAGDMALDQIKK